MSVDHQPAVVFEVERRSVAPWLIAVAIGVGIGAGTSYLQTVLHSPWAALANSASPWLAGGFAAGALHTRDRLAAAAGLLTCVLEVCAYYVTTVMRGYAVADTEMVFWTICAIVGGPLFGVAGYLWWHRRNPGGAALLPAAFAAEAIGLYALVLNYTSTAVLYEAIALGLTLLLGLRTRSFFHLMLWLVGFMMLGIAGEYLLGHLSQATFG